MKYRSIINMKQRKIQDEEKRLKDYNKVVCKAMREYRNELKKKKEVIL